MKIVTPSEMKAMDLRAVEEGLFSSLQLMQNAAEALYRAVAEELERRNAEQVLLLAGPGNNGGDAYALALLLQGAGFRPALLPLGGEMRSPDCEYYYQRCKEAKIPFAASPEGYPLAVDGVFGTGFRGELPAEIQAVFRRVDAPVVAIDLPSGMAGESGCRSAGVLTPIRTVTFAFYKPCHLLADCGQVDLADIGIPASYGAQVSRKLLRPILPERAEWGHKNSYGAAGLRVGAPEYCGAAALALAGALRSGAGLIYGYLPAEAKAAAAAKFYGPILRDETELLPLCCDAYLIGSGLGRRAEGAAQLSSLWESDLPLVVDGDGLWHLQGMLKPRKGVTVLTPHLGEFARMIGKSAEEVRRDRLHLAEEFAARNELILVLKDAATIVTDGCRTEILSAPCSALAKGGSGDVLAGLLAGLLAGDGAPFDLIKTGVYLHNRAGRLAAEQHSVRTLQPEQIAAFIDDAWMELEHEGIKQMLG